LLYALYSDSLKLKYLAKFRKDMYANNAQTQEHIQSVNLALAEIPARLLAQIQSALENNKKLSLTHAIQEADPADLAWALEKLSPPRIKKFAFRFDDFPYLAVDSLSSRCWIAPHTPHKTGLTDFPYPALQHTQIYL